MRYLIGTLGQATSNLAQILPIPGSAQALTTYYAHGYAAAALPPVPTGPTEFFTPVLAFGPHGLETGTIGSTIVTGSHLAGYVLHAVGLYIRDLGVNDPQWQAALYEVTGTHAGLMAFQCTAEIATSVANAWNENPNFSALAVLKPNTEYVIAVQNKGTENGTVTTVAQSNPLGNFGSLYGTFQDPTSTWLTGGEYALYIRVQPA